MIRSRVWLVACKESVIELLSSNVVIQCASIRFRLFRVTPPHVGDLVLVDLHLDALERLGGELAQLLGHTDDNAG